MKMLTDEKSYFKNMCRTCMKNPKSSTNHREVVQQNLDEVPITGNDNKIISSTILELLFSVQPQIVAELEDELPNCICMECVDKLLQTYDFLKTYRDSDFKYRQYLKCIHFRNVQLTKNESESVEKTEIFDEQIEEIEEIILSNEESATDSEDEDTDVALDEVPADDIEEMTVEELFEKATQDDDDDDDAIVCDVAFEKVPIVEAVTVTVENGDAIDNAEEVPLIDNRSPPKSKKRKKPTVECEISKKKKPSSDDEEQFPCSQCNIILDNRADWKKHMLEHSSIKHPKQTSDGKYLCEYCDKEIATKKNYLNHMEGHTNTSTYICDTCGKSFTQILKFQKHKREHLGKRYPCEICGKVLKTTHILNQHLQRHKGEKTRQCSKCPKKFFDYGSLYQHMSVHATEKPFVCDICQHTFSFEYLLRNHKKRVHGDRKYVCEVCDVSYSSGRSLKVHMLSHTGAKPAICKFCNRSFPILRARHLRLHLGDQIYLCDLCPLRFPSKKVRDEHFASHKDDDEETKTRLLHEREESEKVFYEKMGLKVTKKD